MADTYEHEKPYDLTGQYQETPTPSELGAPYDLHATYDENAGGDTQSVNVIGLTSLVFCNVNVSYTQHIIANGFDS